MKSNGPSCFAVSSQNELWQLQAENTEEMYEWINAINSHIHYTFIRIHGHRVGGFGDTTEQPQYYMLRSDSQKGMAIRTVPDSRGPRTGGIIHPGEIFEVGQLYPSHTAPNDFGVYFRLADDKGWVFQLETRHEPVIVPATGFSFEEQGLFQVHPNCRAPVPLRYGPSFSAHFTGAFVEAGERFQACRRWVSGDCEGCDFLKLQAGVGKEGWVQIFNRPRERPTDPAPQHVIIEASELETTGDAPPAAMSMSSPDHEYPEGSRRIKRLSRNC